MLRATVSLAADRKESFLLEPVQALAGQPCLLLLPQKVRWHGGRGFPGSPWASRVLSSPGWGGASEPGIFLEADLPGDGEGQDEEEGGEADGKLAVCVPGAATGPLRLLCQHSYNCTGRKEGMSCQATARCSPPALLGLGTSICLMGPAARRRIPRGRLSPGEGMGGCSMPFPSTPRIPRAKGEG